MQSIRSSGGLVWWLILVVVRGEDYTDDFHRQALQEVVEDVHLSNNNLDAASSPAASEQILVHGGMDMTRIGTSTSSNMRSSSSNSSSSSSKGSAGVNVLAVMLVTASSVMVFLVLRLSLCQWNTSAEIFNSNNGSAAIETTRATTTYDERKQHGLGQDDIDKFTVLVDYSSLLRAMATNSSSSMENVRSCTVCLSEFAAEDNKIRILPACNHSFHTECIDLWLFSHMSCPLCRGSLIPTQASSAPVVVEEVPMLIPTTTGHAQASAPVVLQDPMASAADDAHPQGSHLVVDIK